MTDELRSPDPGSKKEEREHREERSGWRQAAKYADLGFVLPACTFVGWAIGAGLDRWLGTHWITLTGVVLGIVAGFVQLARVAIKLSK